MDKELAKSYMQDALRQLGQALSEDLKDDAVDTLVAYVERTIANYKTAKKEETHVVQNGKDDPEGTARVEDDYEEHA